MEYTIVNGSQHGEKLKLEEHIEDGHFVNVASFAGSFRRNIVGDAMPIRYATPSFTRKYHVIGGFAFYVGELINVSPIVEEAERVLGPIAKNMKEKDAV